MGGGKEKRESVCLATGGKAYLCVTSRDKELNTISSG